MDVISNLDSNIITFGINNKKADFNAKDITFDKNGHASYDVYRNKKKLGRVNMSIPGIHNVSNALSAIAVCDLLGCSFKTITAGIQKFTGTKRRFEIKGIKNGVTVVDDYAHHPSEIIQTLNAAKKITKNNLWCIFQPHTYTRTIALFDEFQKAFDLADHVIVTDIYAAREKDTGKINSKQLAKGISLYHNDVRYLKSFNEISSYVASNAHDGDIIITMGAGSITELGNIILSNLCTSVP